MSAPAAERTERPKLAQPAELTDVVRTPAELLDAVRADRAAAEAAEGRIIRLAVEWADAHPVLEGAEGWYPWRSGGVPAEPLGRLDSTVAGLPLTGDAAADAEAEERIAWAGIPPVAWDAPAAFAAANRMSTQAGKALIRDALVLAHRLPRTWARVVAGEVPAWRGRRVAEAVLGAPADVCAYVDAQAAPRAGSIGVKALADLLEEATLRLHAEAAELEQAEVLETGTHVTIEADAQADGTTTMHACADWRDLHDLGQTLSRLAALLKDQGDPRPLDARRATALGILADPATAAALLAEVAEQDRPAPSRRAVLHLHITDWALLGTEAVAWNETARHHLLVQQVHSWLARTDTHLTVRPVLDLNTEIATDAYTPTSRQREQAYLTNPTCVFPWCNHRARTGDLDHIDPWDPDPDTGTGGSTTTSNLAPLCRHHHRLKTHAGWTYHRLDHRQFLWRDPHGTHYLRDHDRTLLVERE